MLQWQHHINYLLNKMRICKTKYLITMTITEKLQKLKISVKKFHVVYFKEKQKNQQLLYLHIYSLYIITSNDSKKFQKPKFKYAKILTCQSKIVYEVIKNRWLVQSFDVLKYFFKFKGVLCDYFCQITEQTMPVSQTLKYLLRVVSMPLYITEFQVAPLYTGQSVWPQAHETITAVHWWSPILLTISCQFPDACLMWKGFERIWENNNLNQNILYEKN